jgi:cytochrome c oxidase subunit 3
MKSEMTIERESSVLAPYFNNLEQQHEVNQLGMWVFLVTEVMLFGGIFMSYAVYTYAYPEAFGAASRELNLVLSTINTFVLLCSSLTMALAVRSAQLSRRRALVLFLVLTMVLGWIFLGIKATEYYEDYTHHLIPGPAFQFEVQYLRQAQLFFILFFAATGLHGVHMLVGELVLTYLAIKSWRGFYTGLNYDDIENAGLYWHFVDIAWVFIFPLFYLIERSS